MSISSNFLFILTQKNLMALFSASLLSIIILFLLVVFMLLERLQCFLSAGYLLTKI